MAFCDFYFKNGSENLYLIYFNLNLPMLYLGTVRVLSGVANVVSKCDCSIALSFRDVTFLNFHNV